MIPQEINEPTREKQIAEEAETEQRADALAGDVNAGEKAEEAAEKETKSVSEEEHVESAPGEVAECEAQEEKTEITDENVMEQPNEESEVKEDV